MRRINLLAIQAALGALLLLGCSHDSADVSAESFAVAGDRPLSKLTLTLQPRLQPTAGVAVIYELSGPDVRSVQALALAPQSAGTSGAEAVRYLLVRDDGGLIDTARDVRAGRFILQRKVEGSRLRVSYLAEQAAVPGRLDLTVSPDTLTGVGYSFLALPQLDRRLDVQLKWKLGALQPVRAATSLGVGEEVTGVAKPIDLAHSFYLAGPLEVQRREGSQDQLIALGRPSFDRAAVLELCSATLKAARQLFAPHDNRPFSFVFLAEPGLGTNHDGASLYRSFSVWFDRDRKLDSRFKILIAHELLHQWLGWQLRLVTPDQTDAKWFSEGFTVHFARTVLLRAELIEPAELLADLQRDLDAQREAFSRPQLRNGRRQVQNHRSPEYHQGALYAARLDAQLRQSGQGGLEQLVTRLHRQASGSADATLPVAAFSEAVVTALGPAAAVELEELVLQPERPIDLPDNALGTCFRKARQRQAVYELGFDTASLKAEPKVITGVVAGSAAYRAGLRDGMTLQAGESSIVRRDPHHPVSLIVADEDGRSQTLKYRPQRWQLAGWAWTVEPSCRSTAR